jgi:broad specificity phosphatase PhoE
MIYLVRHAHAGPKRLWTGPDDLRPLSARGRRQARGLVAALEPYPVWRVVSSPAARCRQTVQPLAADCGFAVDLDQRLAVGAADEAALALVFDPATDGAVLCSHGEVIGHLLDALRVHGARIGPHAPCRKGSVWLLDITGGRVRHVRYLPPQLAPDRVREYAGAPTRSARTAR